ncbi:MAG: hypothetical protein R3F30_16465 [Planctomycetota bacterium]
MIGTIVIVTLLASLAKLVTQNNRLHRGDEELQLAYSTCRTTMEVARNLPFSVLPTLDGSGFDVPNINGDPGGLRAVEGDADGLTGEIKVTVDQAVGTEKIYLVELVVHWTGSMGERRFGMSSLMSMRVFE